MFYEKSKGLRLCILQKCKEVKKMKTKLLTIFVVGFLAMSFMIGFVSAEGSNVPVTAQVISSEDGDSLVDNNSADDTLEVNELDSSGIFWNKIQRAFTFSKEKKAEISLKIAEKRMAQAAKLSKAEKYEKAKEISKKHKMQLEKAEAYLKEVEVNGDEGETKKALASTIKIQNKIGSHKQKVVEIHAAILEKNSETMTEEQLAHLEEVFEMIESKLEESEEKFSQKQENLKTKYKLQSEMTDEEIEEAIEEYKENLSIKEQERIQKKEQAIEAIKKKIQDKKASSNSDSSSATAVASASGNDAKVAVSASSSSSSENSGSSDSSLENDEEIGETSEDSNDSDKEDTFSSN